MRLALALGAILLTAARPPCDDCRKPRPRPTHCSPIKDPTVCNRTSGCVLPEPYQGAGGPTLPHRQHCAVKGALAALLTAAIASPAHARTRCGGEGSHSGIMFRNCVEVGSGILRCKGARYAEKERGECLGRSEESRRLCRDAQQRRFVPLPP